MYNILIHHPAEGEGDCGRMKVHWKESQTLHKTISKEMDGAVASRFKLNLCMSSLRVTPRAITAFHPDNYI